jgi:NitT/TauT family transport system ATP-binding protein
MTNPEVEVQEPAALPSPAAVPRSPYAEALPHARVGSISGLLELILEQPEGRDAIPRLADSLQLEVDDLLPILDAAVLLGFATVAEGDVTLTEIGRQFATATILESKDLFRQQVLEFVPVLVNLVRILEEKDNRSMRADFFLDLWDEHFPHAEAERQFSTAVDWGRYAELFEYDAGEERLYLPQPEMAEMSP